MVVIGLHYTTWNWKYTMPKKLEIGDAVPIDLGKYIICAIIK